MRLYILSLFVLKISFIASEILFVFEHFRHGVPGPSAPSSSTEFIDKFGILWETNVELTGIGMRTQYLIGVRNRIRYQNFLSSIYDPKEILIFSTQLNRNILSAQAQLQGMFPPQTGGTLTPEEVRKAIPPNPLTPEMRREIKELGNNSLPEQMQLIPIHTFNVNEYKQLLSDDELCPPLRSVKNKLRSNERLTSFYDKLNKTYGVELKKYFQMKSFSFLFDYYRLYYLFDVFLIDYANHKDLSSLEKVGIDLNKFYALAIEMKSIYLYESELNESIGVQAASPSMRKILIWMDKRIEQDQSPNKISDYDEPKFVMYSGSDSSIAPFQIFMKLVFDIPLKYPIFSSNIFYELHKDNDAYYVEYYMNDELLLRMSYEEFKQKVKTIIWSDDRIMQYCAVPMKGRAVIVIVVGLVVIICVLFLTLSVLCIKKEKRTKRKKERLSQQVELKEQMV